jgi:hypothetical protein
MYAMAITTVSCKFRILQLKAIQYKWITKKLTVAFETLPTMDGLHSSALYFSELQLYTVC